MSKFFPILFAVAGISSTVFADSDLPAYVPGGSVSPVSVDTVMSPMLDTHGNGWWYFVGNLHDNQGEAHSVELNIIRPTFTQQNKTYGIGGLGLTFKNAQNKDEYLWNFYPDGQSLINYPVALLQYANADQRDFHVQLQSDLMTHDYGYSYTFSHDKNDTHHIGEIGASYQLTAEGVGEVGVANNNRQFLHYQLKLILEDQRGFVPEGFQGYVGALKGSSLDISSWEMAMPNLKVNEWELTLSPVGTVNSASPVQKEKHYVGDTGNDRVWLDRQILNNPSDQSTMFNTLVKSKLNNTLSQSDFKPLYHGTWMSFCFDKTRYKNVCGVAVAIWNQGIPVGSMNSDFHATSGFLNLFTPDSNTEQSPPLLGNTYTDLIYVNGDKKAFPYRITNVPETVFQSPISQAFYSREVNVKIRAHSMAARILNQYESNESIHDYYLKFKTTSSITENIMLENSNGFYEGAAVVSLCRSSNNACKPVGFGFVEQMGY